MMKLFGAGVPVPAKWVVGLLLGFGFVSGATAVGFEPPPVTDQSGT